MAAGESRDEQRQRLGQCSTVVGEVRRWLIPETPVNGYDKLVLHSLENAVTNDSNFDYDWCWEELGIKRLYLANCSTMTVSDSPRPPNEFT